MVTVFFVEVFVLVVVDVVVDVGPVGGALDVAFEDVPDGLGL